jgi:tetratricopeptide (TPR) repeat protein
MRSTAERAGRLAAEGERLYAQGALEAAEACFREALALEVTAQRLHNLATVHQLRGELEPAEAGFRESLALDPGNPRARASLALVLLAQGRWAEGFSLYDAWREVPGSQARGAPDIGLPRWAGEDVAGKRVVIWGEEGLGDQIMYARFARILEAEGAEVGWIAPSPLVRLVREGLGQRAAPMKTGVRIEGADLVAPTSRLASVLTPRLGAPPPAPYLSPPPPKVVPGLALGVVARGSPGHDNDARRSLTPEAAQALLALPGAVSLLPEDTGARDFWDTAALVMSLDLVISVDTSVVHLAGALGRPVWVLLPAIGCDWRWGVRGDTTPWYPTARLFRQRTPGDWMAVVDEVKAALSNPSTAHPGESRDPS